MSWEKASTGTPTENVQDDIVHQIVQAIRNVKSGQVRILIQDSRVVQIKEIP